MQIEHMQVFEFILSVAQLFNQGSISKLDSAFGRRNHDNVIDGLKEGAEVHFIFTQRLFNLLTLQ